MTVSVTAQGPIAIVTIDNPPVNAAGYAVRRGLIDALENTEADASIQAVVLICAGPTFVAGADIREFDQTPKEPHLPEVVRALESATKPWVAAIHGTALGGGLELTLGCSYRIATTEAWLGLPEVNLGLIPGAGGTVRLPRLIGPEAAFEMITSGKPIPATRTAELGLIDAVVNGDLRRSAIDFATSVAGRKRPQPLLERIPVTPKNTADWSQRIASITARARGQNAPLAAIEAVENAIRLTGPSALEAERKAFLALKDDPQSSALRHVFFAERNASRMPELKGFAARPLDHIGVIGGGTMGAGIATACLLAGLSVTMIERNENALDQGRKRVGDILANSLSRKVINPTQHSGIIEKFRGSTSYEALNSVDLAIEAVYEDMDAKHAVFAELDRVTRPACILASNTSYLDINAIADATGDPSRVIGLHFFSPAHIMKLLELIVTDKANPEALATGRALGKTLGKITVPAGVCDGFIGNRIMSAYRRDCDAMLEDGALPWTIDAAMRDFGFPMGIYEMQDLAGLDISWAMRKRQAASRDPAERYVFIADQLCEAGRFGRKTGKGWYLYDGKTARPDPEVEAMIEAESVRKGITRQDFSASDIMTRILTAMRQTGHALLSEGIARSADDIDVVMVNGYGFPRWKGGPMYGSDGCSA